MNGTELILRQKYCPQTLETAQVSPVQKAAPAAQVAPATPVHKSQSLSLSRSESGTEHKYPYPHGSSFDDVESLMQFACKSATERDDSEEYFQKMLAQMLIQFKKAKH